MSDLHDHSQSGFEERGAGPEPRRQAERFWGEYARQTRPGGSHNEQRPGPEAGNGQGRHDHAHECVEWCPICRTADVLRSSAAPELRGQLQSLQHDALVTVRALLDAFIERLEEAPGRDESAVEDIPID